MNRKLEDITDKEIETYMTISDFKPGRIFFVVLLVATSLSFLVGANIFLTILIVCGARFLLLPIYMNIVGNMAKKSNPAQYREFLNWKKNEYYEKFYKDKNITMEQHETAQLVSNVPFIKRAFNGDLGLAISFWVFGVFAFLAVAGVRETMETTDGLSIYDLLFVGYATFAFVVVGRAAQKYKGFKLWKILAFIYAFILLGIQLPGFILMDVLGL
jgi:hypothetical protein